LDLPAVSHVYNLGVPEDENAYLHRAGRSGRIGSTAGGIITTLVTGEELPRLQELGRRLGVEIQVEQAPEGVLAQQVAGGGQEPPDLEKLRRGLEDLYSLM
jgi:superfamily II DNA/RNA helicase